MAKFNDDGADEFLHHKDFLMTKKFFLKSRTKDVNAFVVRLMITLQPPQESNDAVGAHLTHMSLKGSKDTFSPHQVFNSFHLLLVVASSVLTRTYLQQLLHQIFTI